MWLLETFLPLTARRIITIQTFIYYGIMASVKVRFQESSNDDSQGCVVYEVTHGRRTRTIMSKFKIFRYEWDSVKSRVRFGHPAKSGIDMDLSRFTRIIKLLEESGVPYTCSDVIDEYNSFCNSLSIFQVLTAAIHRLKGQGRLRTAAAYRQTLNSFSRFRCGNDIVVDEITPEIIEGYQASLRVRGNSLNTVSFYMRILRAAYNAAIENASLENRHPFRRVFTGLAKTKKRAVSITVIKRIKNLDLSGNSDAEFARDMFLLSFYLRGMSLVDMAFLRKACLCDGRLVYQRHKTGQTLEIEWRKEMQAVIDKYPPNPTDYLLPIITKKGVNEYVAYRKIGCKINKHLREIARMVGAPNSLTLYVARHSWASAAKSKHVPIGVICEALGHDSETTTQIYLASLETSVVDRANSMLLSLL